MHKKKKRKPTTGALKTYLHWVVVGLLKLSIFAVLRPLGGVLLHFVGAWGVKATTIVGWRYGLVVALPKTTSQNNPQRPLS